MNRKLERDFIAADLAAVEAMLQSLSEDDVLGKAGFESRREALRASLRDIEHQPQTYASTALIFAGQPVVGALGIKTEFAGNALTRYQDLVAKVLAASSRGNLGQRGVVPGRDSATLHVTKIVHGSFGFVLEEIENGALPLGPTALKVAADEAAQILISFADDDEDRFAALLVEKDRRVFDAAAEFFRHASSHGAAVRIVAGELDKSIDENSIAIAAERAGATQIIEEPREFVGTLLGVLPEAHRFEFRVTETNEVISGGASAEISSEELRNTFRALADARTRARLHVRELVRPGRPSRSSYTLLGVERDGQL